MQNLSAHNLKVAILQPQIAPNTGNIARLCVATGTELHLVRPMGFVLGDRELRRSAMDYWPRLKLTLHDDNHGFFEHFKAAKLWMFSTRGQQSHWDAGFDVDDILVFGSETKGLDEALLANYPENVLRIPQVAGERCLNLATAVGIALYEALRQVKT